MKLTPEEVHKLIKDDLFTLEMFKMWVARERLDAINDYEKIIDSSGY